MTRILALVVTFIVYLIIGLLIMAALGGAITRKPLLLTVIRSGSMNPVLQRGDIVLFKRNSEGGQIKVGDIVVFRSETGSLSDKGWIMHRVTSGDPVTGYITKGDANRYSDQDDDGAPPIKPRWIAGKAVCIGKIPVKIPVFGYLPLWLEGLQKNPFLLPGFAVILSVVAAASELQGKKKKGNHALEQQLIYFIGGLTLAFILGVTMLAISQHSSFKYEVSGGKEEVILGSPVGVLKLGETATKPVTKISNKGFLPITAVITTDDPQVVFNKDMIVPSPGQLEEVIMTVTARKIGQYQTTVWVGVFLPLLPQKLIYYLAQKSFWLALVVTSSVPALPLILYPFWDARLRHKSIKEVRRTLRKARRHLPLPF